MLVGTPYRFLPSGTGIGFFVLLLFNEMEFDARHSAGRVVERPNFLVDSTGGVL